jgi:hypothetical protein
MRWHLPPPFCVRWGLLRLVDIGASRRATSGPAPLGARSWVLEQGLYAAAGSALVSTFEDDPWWSG